MSDDKYFTIEYEGRKTIVKEKYVKDKRWDIVERVTDILLEQAAIDRFTNHTVKDVRNPDNLLISYKGTTFVIPNKDIEDSKWNIAYVAIERLIEKTKDKDSGI